MLLQDFLPSAPLRRFVKCFRIIDFSFEPGHPVPPKAYPPKPEQTLHFFLKEPFLIGMKDRSSFQPPSILFKAQQTSLLSQLTGLDFLDVQIVFQPTAVYHLTGIPATTLADQFWDGTKIFPHEIESVFTQLQESQDYITMIRIAETFVHSLIERSKTTASSFDGACDLMVNRHGNISIERLAFDSSYSIKQFTRKFSERVGLNPKLYSRILRMNRAYNLRNFFPSTKWNCIAANAGYSDYQHLAKDYKEFTSFTPAELHSLEQQSPENLLGLSKSIYRKRVADLS